MTLGFEILHEEGPSLVVLKPSGVLTQAPPGIDSLETRIKRFLKQRDQKPGNVYLGVPHRLDRPVSGVMVFAKHVRAARAISSQFEDRTVDKTYWAVVEGEVAPDQGTWTDYVRKTPGEARAEVVAENHPHARIAVLHYRVTHRHQGLTWLEIQLETGRTHQIRVQAATRNVPILGDLQYGAGRAFGANTDNERLREIALHARQLEFNLPKTKQRISVTGAVPAAWTDLSLPIPHDDSNVAIKA